MPTPKPGWVKGQKPGDVGPPLGVSASMGRTVVGTAAPRARGPILPDWFPAPFVPLAVQLRLVADDDRAAGKLMERGASWDRDRQLWRCPTAFRPRRQKVRPRRRGPVPEALKDVTRAHLAMRRPPSFATFQSEWLEWSGTDRTPFRTLPRWQRRAIRSVVWREWMLFVARDFAPEYWPMPVRIEAARAEVKRSGPRAVILRRNGVESRHDFRPRTRGSASLTPATDVPSTRRRSAVGCVPHPGTIREAEWNDAWRAGRQRRWDAGR